MCFRRTFALAVSTTPAARVSPDSSVEASVSTFSTVRAGGGDLAFDRDAVRPSLRSPTCISASTKKRRPSSVGSRPAEVCGA